MASDKQKERMSSYISGNLQSNFREFESQTISFLIGVFCKPENIEILSKRRILFYSVSMSLSTLTFIGISQGNISGIVGVDYHFVRAYLFMAFAGIISGFLFDYYSIFVTKLLFYYKSTNIYVLPFMILLDVMLSYIPTFVTMWAYDFPNSELPPLYNLDNYTTLLYTPLMASFINLVGNAFVSILQVFILLSGIILRIMSKSKMYLTRRSYDGDLIKNPFTACSLLFALLVLLFDVTI